MVEITARDVARALAGLRMLSAVFYLIVALAALGVSINIIKIPEPYTQFSVAIATLALLLAIIRISSGWGLWMFQPWAWKLSVFFLISDMSLSIATNTVVLPIFLLDAITLMFIVIPSNARMWGVDLFAFSISDYFVALGIPLINAATALLSRVTISPAAITPMAAAISETPAPTGKAEIDFLQITIVLTFIGAVLLVLNTEKVLRRLKVALIGE